MILRDKMREMGWSVKILPESLSLASSALSAPSPKLFYGVEQTSIKLNHVRDFLQSENFIKY